MEEIPRITRIERIITWKALRKSMFLSIKFAAIPGGQLVRPFAAENAEEICAVISGFASGSLRPVVQSGKSV
jgi:hypothetical protein